MNCVICNKSLTKDDTKEPPYNVCVTCFWKEVKLPPKKRHIDPNNTVDDMATLVSKDETQ